MFLLDTDTLTHLFLGHPRVADLLIVAVTLANRAKLVFRHEKDLRQVPGLQIENWANG